MKVNKSGLYIVTEDSIFIEDPKTKERQLFLLDRENKIVLRSMTENDIKLFISKMEITSSQKRKKMRLLSFELPKPDSQFYFYVAEKIVGKEGKSWNSIYEQKRIPIGLGARDSNNTSIEMSIYDCEKEHSHNVLRLVAELGKYYGINGDEYFIM